MVGETQDDIDRHWLEHVYRPDERQLTGRAVVAGMLLGGVLSVANLYIGLKVGWSLGMALTSTVLAFVTFRVLRGLGLVRDEFTMLENNTVASTSSAAGYFCSAGMVSAIPALFITQQRILVWWELALWMLAVSFIGVVMAVPMRRQMIDIDRLRFPSGTACAETIRSMHQSASEAVAKARALLLAATIAFLLELPAQLAGVGGWTSSLHWKYFGVWKLPFGAIAGHSLYSYTLALPSSSLLYGAGAIVGIRVGLSMGIAALVLYAGFTPWLASHGLVVVAPDDAASTYRSVVSWAVWPGVLGATAASLLAFALKWRSILSSFGSIGQMARSNAAPSRMADVEVPPAWFGWGLVLSTALICFAARLLFDIPVWMSVVATALSYVLAIVACRSTGETDVTPIASLGKITQLTFAGIRPGHYETNLMTASITAGAAAHSADLLTDLKTGYLLGGSPRRQFIAQFMGILAGAIFCVPAYMAMVGDGDKLGSATYPAPSAQTWAVVADLLANGAESVERGPAEVSRAEIETLALAKRPAKLSVGDTLRLGGETFTVVGFERKTLVLDRDLPANTAPQAIEILAPDGSVRGGAPVQLTGTAKKAALRFAALPAGTRVSDYVRGERDGSPVYHQVKALRGSLALVDHELLVPGDGPVPVQVLKTTLPPYAGTWSLIFVVAGVLVTLLEVYGPRRLRGYLPSMAGIGIAWVITGYDCLAMAVGAIFAWALGRLAPAVDERYTVPASSGVIAGASIAGLILTGLALAGWVTLG